MKNNFPRKCFSIISSENSSWDNLLNCSNCTCCYDSLVCKDCKRVYDCFNSVDCQDVYLWWADRDERASTLWYETDNSFNCNRWIFCSTCWAWCNNVIYCDSCYTCKNCFWSTWLRNKEYCILNKQYTKEQYNSLVPKIIEHMQKTWEWWEFFLASISPFWYNETVAQEYFPLNPPLVPLNKGENLNEVKVGGFNRSDYEEPFPKVDKIIKASDLPNDIKDIPDDILNRAIECEVTKKPFKIIKQELDFYRKHNLPIPRRHPDQRHLDRMKLRNPRKLFDRKCDKCWIDIKTTYSPDRSEIVYCEKCYNEEVY